MSLRLPLMLSVLLLPVHAHAQDWVAESNAISEQVLGSQARFQPELVAGFGLDGFDAEIIDLKPGVYVRRLDDMRRLVDFVGEQRRTVEHPKVQQDLDILQQSLEDQIHTSELNRRYMLPYYNIPQTLFFGFRSLLDPRTDPGRYPAALTRLARYTGRDGGRPITEMARARTAERFEVDGLIGPFQGEITKDLDNIPRYIAGLRGLFEGSGLEGWQDDFTSLEQQLSEYGAWIEAEVMPRGRSDHRLPAEIYADNLKNFGVRAAPEDLIRMAQFGFQEIKTEMRALARQIAAQRGWENGELMYVMREFKQQQVPPEQIIDVYRQRLAAIEDLIREHDVVTLPQRAASIRLATEAESARIPAPFMSPPQLIGNTGQYGEFVLVQNNPSMEGPAAQMDDWSHDAVTWAVTVHEARPGHEMQFASLVENGTSQARAIYAFNSANVEGWGLYAEAIMLEYLPPEGQLFTLLGRLARAARMFLDPMVNLGQITPEEAVSFIMDEVGLSEAMARSEADRYAFLAPGQATSYYYGYINLQRLRTEVELKLRDRFDQRAFHDFVLAQGLLPPELLRHAVLEEFVPSQ